MAASTGIVGAPVGNLFLGAIVPGLLLGGLSIAYIIFVAITRPNDAPVSQSEPLQGSLILALFRDLFAPLFLILMVLGSIATGTATPIEAAGLGAISAMLVAVNLQTSFLTPPFGYSLFYIKGVAPP